jgi:hypothetical protein
VRLIIPIVGRPAPQGSKRSGASGQLLEQSAYLPAWRAAVKAGAFRAYQAAGIGPGMLPVFPTGPVVVEQCVFFVTDEQCRAEGTDEPCGPPDIDKLLRATLDALGGARQRRGTARLYADDAQVTKIRNLDKVRPGPGDSAGAVIIVSDGRD